MVLGTLEASLLGNMLAGKSNVRAGYGNEEGKGMLRAGSGSKKKKKNSASTSSFKRNFKSRFWIKKKKKILLPPHPLRNFEIQKYYQNQSRFNGVFSRDNLANKIKVGAYVINLDEYANTSTH